MGEAREVMDRVTAAVAHHDRTAARMCYAQDAIAVTPDQGEIKGPELIAAYLLGLLEALPDLGYDSVQRHEAGNVAIDEGFVTGTNSGPLAMPSGQTVPATGRKIKMRMCDVATIERGLITQHHIYFDQLEVLAQLGLSDEVS